MPVEPAEERLERILWILPAAGREGGAELGVLAAELGVPVERILADVQEVTDRVYSYPPGKDLEFDIAIEGERLEVWSGGGEFLRPHRLTPMEGLALTIGLRALAQSEPDRAEEIRALADRLDREIASAGSASHAEAFALGDDAAGDAILAALRDAAEDRRACRLEYLKSGADAPEERVVHPYALVYAHRWYALGPDAGGDAVRAFRLDRIVSVRVEDATFEVPTEFDPAPYVAGGVLFMPGDEVEAVVRYAPGIARWLAERGDGETRPDGSVVLRHRVADPAWILRHVLYHGSDAELIAPPELRARLAQVAAEIARP